MSEIESGSKGPSESPEPIDRNLQVSDEAFVAETTLSSTKRPLIFDYDAYINSGSYKQMIAMYRSNPYAVKRRERMR
jgi:hypothetical protein